MMILNGYEQQSLKPVEYTQISWPLDYTTPADRSIYLSIYLSI